MKKLIKGMLALALTLSLVGCGGSSEGGASGEKLTKFQDYQTLANEMETWNVLYSQSAAELNVLANCVDGLLTNDTKGAAVPCVAKEWTHNDDFTEWTFKLNEGVQWVDYKGEVQAELTAQDYVTGLEYILNYSKNSGANSSMPREMIAGAEEYYQMTSEEFEATKAVSAETEAKFLDMVGISTPDDYTIVYTMISPKPYFDTLACYSALFPVAQAALDAYGEKYGTNNETIWYDGPYICSEYIQGSYKVLTPNPTWWGKDSNEIFEEVHIQMVEDSATAWALFQSGELDYITLPEDALSQILKEGEGSEYYQYLVESKPTKYAYVCHFNYNAKLADGSDDNAWNTAIANKNFRLAWYHGINWTDFLKRINQVNPGNCIYDGYTKDSLVFTSDGTDYADLVTEKLGYKTELASDAVHARYNEAKAKEAIEAAKKELTDAGIELPVTCWYSYMSGNQTGADTAKVFKQMIESQLGDLVKVEFVTYSTSYAQEIRNTDRFSLAINGWGADFGDPCNYLGQETDSDNAFYNSAYSNLTVDIDPEYQTYLDLYEKADAMTDLDERYNAFAEAEAYWISQAYGLPLYRSVPWQITKVNDYSKITAMYGMQSARYVNWETTTATGYTADDYAAFAK